MRDQGIGPGERWIAKRRAYSHGVPMWEVQPLGRGERAKSHSVLTRLLVEGLVDSKSLAGKVNRRLQRSGQARRTPLPHCLRPRGESPRDADGNAARHELRREVVGLARMRVDERVVRHRDGCGLAAVE